MSRLFPDDAPACPMSFPTEEAAEDFICSYLAPYCSVVKRQVRIKGIRVDVGFRLKILPSVPLVIEVKKFEHYGSDLTAAILQAHDYSTYTRYAAFVGPVQARNVSALSWYLTPLGAMGLLAGQMNVGYLAFDRKSYPTSAMLFHSGQAAAYLREGKVELHPHAETLFQLKWRCGSLTRRDKTA